MATPATHAFSEAALKELGDSPAGRVATIAASEGGTALLPADSCRLYFAGADKFGDLLSDLADARSTCT